MVINNGSMNCTVFTQWNTCFNCVFLGSVICLLLGTHLSQGQTNGPSYLPLSLASQLLWECKIHITNPPTTNSNTYFHFLPMRGCSHRYTPTGIVSVPPSSAAWSRGTCGLAWYAVPLISRGAVSNIKLSFQWYWPLHVVTQSPL